MGFREYGVRVDSCEDVAYLKGLVEAHNSSNDDTGSCILACYASLEYEGKIYVVIESNGGSAKQWISTFMAAGGRTPLEFLWPFEKPQWWNETPTESIYHLHCSWEMKVALLDLAKASVIYVNQNDENRKRFDEKFGEPKVVKLPDGNSARIYVHKLKCQRQK